MIKTLQILLLVLLFITASDQEASAKLISEETETSNKAKTEKYISYVYSKIKFTNANKLKYEVFRSALYGYLNMREENKLGREGILSVCDFTLSSNRKRLWVFDLKAKKLLHHSLVAHGMGTGEEYATAFSNVNESHQSSLGFYVTAETYMGNNGYSLKLMGVDGNFNCNAYDRAIVVHGADYVSEQFAKDHIRLGRSHGCPALPVEIAPVVIDRIKNGTCFFIYHKSNNYLSSSRWLTNPVKNLPQEASMMELNTSAANQNDFLASITSSDNERPDMYDETVKEVPKEKVITSTIIVNMNTRSGVSDTTIVK